MLRTTIKKRRVHPAMNRSMVPKRTAQMMRAITARNWMKATMTMKQVIVFWVLMNFVRPGFFLHFPNTAIRQPKKAAMRKGKGKIPISLIVIGIQAVLSVFSL